MRHALRARNAISRIGANARSDTQQGSTTGIVTSFDPVTQTAKVMLQPYGIETGYIPVKTMWAGNGWGIFSPPSKGDAVDVHFETGDLDNGYIMGRHHNDIEKALPTPSGELWLVHGSGITIKLLNNGKAIFGGPASGAGSIMLGNLADLHTFVKDTFVALFNAHTHPTPSGSSGAPAQQMTAVHLTIETVGS